MPGIPGIDKPISRIVLGTMILDTDRKEECFAFLDAAYECGINTFDTAAVYAEGASERCLGMWCAERGLREKVVILDKGCHQNADRKRVTTFDLAADLHDTLARLQTNCIDLYMLHRDDPSVPVGPIVQALNEHHKAGRIKAFGVSNWSLHRIREAIRYAVDHDLQPFAANSPNYGLAEQVENPWGPGCTSLSGPDNKADRDWHIETQMPVFAYSSLGRGLFSGRLLRDNYREIADDVCERAYCHEVNFQRLDRAMEMARQKGVSVPQIALAFVLNSRMNIFALVGAASREEIEQCVAVRDIRLSEAELTWLETGSVEPSSPPDS
ncbi:MAG: aldo/keto reductase [Planctomycetota bacterium]|jgi:aryl-alcohol dehydrogenase-like predicted oxidoreductase|nr:aldo/keto reductase [Planctomycetota bacterium]